MRAGIGGVSMDSDDFKKIEEMFKHQMGIMSKDFEGKIEHQMGIMSEDFQHKLDIVVEGHQMLSDKIDRLDGRIDRLENKVDAIAGDLAAHRADTEAHGTVYRVKESWE